MLRIQKQLIILLSFLFLFSSVLFAEDEFNPKEKVYKVVTYDSKGNPRTGTGFFTSKRGVLSTAYHVVSGAKWGYVSPVSSSKMYKIIAITSISIKYDIAQVKVDIPRSKTEILRMSYKINEGDRIRYYGFPVPDIKFSGVSHNGYSYVDQSKTIRFFSPVKPGYSGSPILNSKNRVIGVVTTAIHPVANFIIPGVNLFDPLTVGTSIRAMPLCKEVLIRMYRKKSFIKEDWIRFWNRRLNYLENK